MTKPLALSSSTSVQQPPAPVQMATFNPFVNRVDDLALVDSLKANADPGGDARVHIQAQVDQGMLCALPLASIDNRMIVMIDTKARVGAVGFPHGQDFLVIERHAGDRIKVHQMPGPILSAGNWELVRVIVAVNSQDAWGGPGVDGQPLSVESLIKDMHDFERRTATPSAAPLLPRGPDCHVAPPV